MKPRDVRAHTLCKEGQYPHCLITKELRGSDTYKETVQLIMGSPHGNTEHTERMDTQKLPN